MKLQNSVWPVQPFLRAHRAKAGPLLTLLLCAAAPALPAPAGDLLDEVDPLIGTGGRGFGIGSVPPGAQVPFGLVRLSLDTALDELNIPWRHTGGYHHRDTHGAGAAGLDGNDDCGTLSSGSLFSALGYYPLAGTTRYWIGSPILDFARVHLAAGDLEIVGHGAGPGQYYIQSATLDGEPLERPFLDHAQIAAGATLELRMGDQPSDWGR